MLADLRYARRTLARNPGVAFVSILAHALGIGANSAIFPVVNSVLLEPMRFSSRSIGGGTRAQLRSRISRVLTLAWKPPQIAGTRIARSAASRLSPAAE
jgi:hypothetical protein